MKRAIAAAILLLAACGESQQPPAPGTPKKIIIAPPADDAERSSVVNLGHGSVIVARTGEALLESSALAAIDGDPTSMWQTPPKDFRQSLVVALPARTRIEKVGVRVPAKTKFVAKEIVFESSTDGRAFQPLTTINPKDVEGGQWFDVRPTDASFLRVSIPAPSQSGGDVALRSVLARGRELEVPHPGAIDGCWLVNGRSAELRSHGAHTTGTMRYTNNTLLFDGGSNGRFHRLEWIRGAEFGYAAIAVATDGQHLSGEQWHEEPISLFFGDAWFGETVACGGHAAAPADDVVREFLKRTGRHSLYALRFGTDDTLDVQASQDGLKSLVALLRDAPAPRLVARELREATPAANRARAQRILDSLRRELQNEGVELNRVTFVAAGSDDARQIPGSEAARELYSTVDLEVRR